MDTFYVPGTVLDAEDRAVNIAVSTCMELAFQCEKIDNEQINIFISMNKHIIIQVKSALEKETKRSRSRMKGTENSKGWGYGNMVPFS